MTMAIDFDAAFPGTLQADISQLRKKAGGLMRSTQAVLPG